MNADLFGLKITLRGKEVTSMAYNQAQAISTRMTAEQAEVSEGMRLARYSGLDELPGLIYGIITIGYIAMSLLRLAL
jgi:hypothetical protein